MADTAKTRKQPEPRGLSISLPLPESTEVHELAAMAGHSTKAQVETALAEWLITEGLNFFRAKLAARAQERLNKIKAPNGLTSDGGIPIVKSGSEETA